MPLPADPPPPRPTDDELIEAHDDAGRGCHVIIWILLSLALLVIAVMSLLGVAH